MRKSNNVNCDSDIHDTIRPSSSSLTRAPSWSLGIGADDGNRRRNSLSSIDGELASQSSRLSQTIRIKLNIEIPTVYLTKRDQNKSSFHVYELNIEDLKSGQKWSVFRRYSQFYSLHQQLRSKNPEIGKLYFPPKRRLNSKASTIVQDRQKKLEEYMRSLNHFIGRLPPSQSDLDLASGDSGSIDSSQQQLQSVLSNNDGDNDDDDVDEDDDEIDEDIDGNASEVHPEATLRSESVSLGNSECQNSESNYNAETRSQSRSSSFGGRAKEVNPKASPRSLFNEFIALKNKRDDNFDPSNLSE